MYINTSYSTNFGAKFLTNTEVQKYNPKKKTYSPCNISFVELEPHNDNDLKTLYEVAKYWDSSSYAADVASVAAGIAKDFLPEDKYKIYALTRQTENFHELNPHKILCLSDIELADNQPIEIEFLQVNPQMTYAAKNAAYKNIGGGFLNTLKSLYNKAIILTSVFSAATFYEKNGFEIINPQKLRYIWRPKK